MRNIILSGAVLVIAGACAIAPTETEANHTADIHNAHAHVHGDNCGHVKVRHDDHWDYLHDGHLHSVHGDHVDEHVLEVTDKNPAGEAPMDKAAHADHMHSDADKHMMIRHGDHMDYIHNGHLHNVHGDHVDDHGEVEIDKNT